MHIRPEDYLSITEMEAMGYVPTWGREARAVKADPQPTKLELPHGRAHSNVVRVDFSRRLIAD